MKTGFAKTTHTFPHKEFPWACSDNQQVCNKCSLCQIVKYLLHAYRWNPGCVWVQCFVWQIPKPDYFSIQSCVMGGESTQEYTQLNAFLLCVSDSGWQWGQWNRGDNGGRWWQLAECIQPAQWIPVRFPQVSASSFPEAGESKGGYAGEFLKVLYSSGNVGYLKIFGICAKPNIYIHILKQSKNETFVEPWHALWKTHQLAYYKKKRHKFKKVPICNVYLKTTSQISYSCMYCRAKKCFI